MKTESPDLVAASLEKSTKIVGVLISSLVSDIVTFVKVAVEADCEREVKQALGRSQREQDDAMARSTQRRDDLKRWTQQASPLARSPDLVYLVRAIFGMDEERSTLSTEKTGCLQTGDIAQIMLDVADGKAVRAPVIAHGQLQYLLRPAMDHIRQLSTPYHDTAENTFTRLVKEQLTATHIAWVPTGSGIRHHTAHFKHWIRIYKDLAQSDIPSRNMTGAERFNQKFADKLNNEVDPRDDWSIGGVAVKNLHKYLDYINPPLDFNLRNAGIDKSAPAVEAGYEWVFKNFRMNNVVHRYCLFVAHIFSLSAPRFSHPPKIPPQLSQDASRIVQHVRQAAWTATGGSKGDKGKKDKLVMTIVSTLFMVAIVDPQSPVRQKKVSMGPWTSKHSKCIPIIRLPWTS